MDSASLTVGAKLAVPTDPGDGIPSQIVDHSGGLGWRHTHVQRWHDVAAVDEFRAPAYASHSLVLVTGGTTVIESKDGARWQRARFVPGSFGMTAAGVTRTLRWQSLGAGEVESIHIYISTSMVNETVDAFGDPRISQFPDVLDLQRPDLVAHARALAWALEHKAPALHAEAAAQVLIGRILTLTRTDSLDVGTGRLGRAVLAELIDYMRARLADDVSLDQLASVARLSKYHLLRQFKASTGMPPHAYLRRLRFEHAASLLCATDLTIRAVAGHCGYRSESQFTAAFRRHHQMTPAQFRSAHRTLAGVARPKA